MRIRKYLFLIIILSTTFLKLRSQNDYGDSHLNKKDSIVTDIRLYAGLMHQHQNFFHQAFSFQGIEAGIILHRKLVLGAFGSSFVSNLSAQIANDNMYLTIWQSGLFIGQVLNEPCRFHYGWLMNAGYFSVKGEHTSFPVFGVSNPAVKVTGLVMMPEICAELVVAKWMKLRTGLGYSFYTYEKQSLIPKADLQNISFTFGFLFGKY